MGYTSGFLAIFAIDGATDAIYLAAQVMAGESVGHR